MGQHIENQARRCIWGHGYPLVEHTVLVPNDGLSLQDFSVILPPNILALPFSQDQQHPLYPKMKLLAVHLSANPSDIQTFHQKLQMLCYVCIAMIACIVGYVHQEVLYLVRLQLKAI